MKAKWIVLICAMLLLAGCSAVCYIRFGPQKLGKVQVLIEGQEADPNFPKGVIGVKVL